MWSNIFEVSDGLDIEKKSAFIEVSILLGYFVQNYFIFADKLLQD